MKSKVTLIAASLLVCTSIAHAQGAPSVTPQVPDVSVPSWVFYWVLGLASAGGAGLMLVIKILWDKADKTSGLSEVERNQLHRLFDWHNQKDTDQVPLWYLPRSWLEHIQGLRNDHTAVKILLTRLVEQNDGINADLRQQIRERLELHDRLHTKMLKLAVRVQQAVEALAGLGPPSIETTLDEDEVA